MESKRRQKQGAARRRRKRSRVTTDKKLKLARLSRVNVRGSGFV
ncbi:hypothetical protein A2U01_0089535, partial [Trifolium medium]|nr:hypothetical protein [Trifolium medium]